MLSETCVVPEGECGMGVVRWLVLVVIALSVAVIGLVVAGATFLTDLLWFDNLGLSSVFWTRLGWEWAIRIGVGVVFALMVLINLFFSRPSIHRLQEYQGPEKRLVPPILFGRWLTGVFVAVSIVLGFLYSAGVGDVWQEVLLFLKRVPFGQVDPTFGRDIGYYMFSLPFYRVLYGSLQGLLWVNFLLAGIVYLISGAVSFAEGRIAVTRRAKTHLSVVLAAMFGLKAWGYMLDIYGLVYSPRGVVFGASYTDVYAYAVGLRILSVVAIVAALALLLNIFRPGIRLTIASIVLLLVASPVVGTVYPNLVQRFVVEPNELAKESPFIVHNIRLTRQAYGLDAVQERSFPTEGILTYDRLMDNEAIMRNIRLWDWRPLLQVYSQLQEMRLYYEFKEVDVDRYYIDGQYRQVMLAARELNPEQVPNQTWINRRLQYTHGYGVVVSPVDEVTAEGMPRFLVTDVPPRSLVPELEVSRPEIYYGELTNDWVVVNSRTPEFDYPKGDENAQVRYQGKGGVQLSNPLIRLAYAVRLGDIKLLISREITSQSRLMFYRNINERVRRIAPFLKYDSDPYLVISKGKLYWLLDAYTTSSYYPFSTPSRGWGNYVRNSVKVVIDPYNGDVQFYVADPQDPLIRAYRRIFPTMFQDLDEMDRDLRQHLRYPEDLFTLQANVMAAYHMENPTVFYNREDLWNIPREIVGAAATTMSPYYVIMQLPGSDKPEMVLMLPFTPARKNNMVAWMAARIDEPNYGRLVLYKFSKRELTYGPMQIEARIDQDAEISQLITLWSQKGSNVYRGNLLVIPVDDSILYVEPVYLQAEQSRLPELKRVIVATGSRVAMGVSLPEAMQQLFGVKPQDAEPMPIEKPAELGGREKAESRDLIRMAVDQFEKAQQYLRSGDWAGYGRMMEELEATLRRLESIQAQETDSESESLNESQSL